MRLGYRQLRVDPIDRLDLVGPKPHLHLVHGIGALALDDELADVEGGSRRIAPSILVIRSS